MSVSPALLDVLSQARVNKFLGPGPLEDHVENGIGFADVVNSFTTTGAEEPHIIDLGSGGGVPALVVAQLLPTAVLRLIERSTNRARFLETAIVQLGMQDRVRVLAANAEEAARDPELAGWADAVTARAFAAPATTAECACRFLRAGGVLIVSEPPAASAAEPRWPGEPLRQTGLVPTQIVRRERSSYQVLTMVDTPSARLPRSPSATRRRPLF